MEYALKRIKIGNLDKKDKENTLNEVRLLASIKNPYVIGSNALTKDSEKLSLMISRKSFA